MCGPTCGGAGAAESRGAGEAAPARAAEPGAPPSKHYLAPQEQADIRGLVGNSECFDCGAERPQWASVSYGIVLCYRCAGSHRSYGVHLSFVRSLELDAWKEPEIQSMLLGGNGNFRVFVTDDSLDLDGASRGGDASARRRLYEGAAAQRYRQQLAQRSGRPSPPPLAQAAAAGSGHEVELLGPKGCEAGSTRCQQQRYQLTPTPARAPPAATAAVARGGPQLPPWAADCDECMLCRAAFTVLFRRHHCRRCGKCVCGNCAPRSESRPIPEWGLADPVRHCKECVCLAMLGQLDS